jgi:hypothetical protein
MDIQGILGIDDEVRNGFGSIRVHFDIRADANEDDIKALVAQSQKRSAVFDIVTNPTNVFVAQLRRRFEGSECREFATEYHRRRLLIVMSSTDRPLDRPRGPRARRGGHHGGQSGGPLRLLAELAKPSPGCAYTGDNPTGFMTMPEVVHFLQRYASSRKPGRDWSARDRARQLDGGHELDQAGPTALPQPCDSEWSLQPCLDPIACTTCLRGGQPHAAAI